MKASAIEEKLRAQARELAERVKELHCLYEISRLFYQPESDLNTVLRESVEVIRKAWQFPEICQVRITFEGTHFGATATCRTRWKQTAPIVSRGRRVGKLEVCYTEPRPERDDGPFLAEEANLIQVLARRIGELAERKWAEGQIQHYQEALRSLARETIRAGEHERRTIAQELHDGLGQTLATTQIKLDLLMRATSSPDHAAALEEIRALISRSIAVTRSLLYEISPPVLDQFGLRAALEWLAEHAREQFGLEVELALDHLTRPLPEEVRATLFRAARELLANVAKHAHAGRACLALERKRGAVRLSIEDDGIGFDVARARESMLRDQSFGLFSIQERVRHLGGTVRIVSGPGQGTRVVLAVPVRADGASGGDHT